MDRTVIGLHGWGSTGEGSATLQRARKYFDKIGVEFITPTYDCTDPDGTAKLLLETLKDCKTIDPFIMGISYGGFWARWLANQAEAASLFMLNPALDAYAQTKKYLGENKHYVTGLSYWFIQARRFQLRKYQITVDKPCIPMTAIIAMDDDIVPPFVTENMIGPDRCNIEYVTGGHRLEKPELWLPKLAEAFNGSNPTMKKSGVCRNTA
jgi:predicted esterase YcpF (UPF0227 family)